MRYLLLFLLFLFPSTGYAGLVPFYTQLPDGSEKVGGGPQGFSAGFRMNGTVVTGGATTSLHAIRFPMTKPNSGSNACGTPDEIQISAGGTNASPVIYTSSFTIPFYIFFGSNQTPNPLTTDTSQWPEFVLDTPFEIDPTYTSYKVWFRWSTSCYGAYRNEPNVHEKYHAGGDFYQADQAIFELLTFEEEEVTEKPIVINLTGGNNPMNYETLCDITATSSSCLSVATSTPVSVQTFGWLLVIFVVSFWGVFLTVKHFT